ncbi:MAG: PAS domain-containing protein [Deltaproteobacteria bacterium]|nr:PAS domain-containing protein [Deltaproteobacteria bacterium]
MQPTPSDRWVRAYDSCPVGICYFDKDLRYVHINEWLADLNGVPAAAHLGRTVKDIVPGVAIGIEDSLRSVLETGIPVVQGAVVEETPGQPGVGRVFTHNYYPDRADDGTIIGVSCFVEEVTHRRQVEVALERTAERYRSVLETVPHGIEYIDVDGKIIYANAALHRLYRCNPGELIGRSVFDFVEESERDSMRAYLAYLVEEQPSSRSHEGRKVAKDGTIIDIRTDWNFRFDSNHQVEGFISVITDRTSEGRLAELEFLYRDAPIGLCFVDPDLRFRRINDRLAEINGKPAAEHIGATVEEVIPDIADQVAPVYKRILRTGESVVGLEVRGILPSDPQAEHVWLVNHHPVKAEDGKILGITTVVEDITRQKRVERELREATELLAEAQRISETGSWAWDLIEDRIWWSAELYQIFGYDHHPELTFETFFARVHPDDRSVFRRQLDLIFELGEPQEAKFRIVRVDGTERLIHSHGKLERTEDGAPARLVGTARVVPSPDTGALPGPGDN